MKHNSNFKSSISYKSITEPAKFSSQPASENAPSNQGAFFITQYLCQSTLDFYLLQGFSHNGTFPFVCLFHYFNCTNHLNYQR